MLYMISYGLYILYLLYIYILYYICMNIYIYIYMKKINTYIYIYVSNYIKGTNVCEVRTFKLAPRRVKAPTKAQIKVLTLHMFSHALNICYSTYKYIYTNKITRNNSRRNHFSTILKKRLIKIIRITKELFCSVYLSPRRELWLTPGMGMGRGKKSRKLFQKTSFLYIVPPWKGTLTDAGAGDRGQGIFGKKKKFKTNTFLSNIFYIILLMLYMFVYFVYYIFCIFCILYILYIIFFCI